MKRNRFGLFVVALTVVVLLSLSAEAAPIAQTGLTVQPESPAVRKWEYASLHFSSWAVKKKLVGSLRTDYYLAIGIKSEILQFEDDQQALTDAFGKALSKFGDGGWELVQIVERENGNQTFYFKRPK